MNPQGKQIQELAFPDNTSVAFDLHAFQQAVQAHGISFVHYRAMIDPVGLIDKDDIRRPDPGLPTAHNGMVYTKAGCFKALLISNTKEVKASTGGLVDASTAQMTPEGVYACGEQVFLAPYDKLYLEDENVLVTRHERLEHNITGIDRPKFPSLKVQDCMDAKGVYYREGVDFKLQNGEIHWGDNRPGINPDTGKGVIFAIRYLYRPHWYVQRLVHEIRMVQQRDMIYGNVMVAAPQTAIVQREFVFENESSQSKTNNRGVMPEDGSLPAR